MLIPGQFYHIYTHANGYEDLFREPQNYEFFLRKYWLHLEPVTETFAWCLMPNHFHSMVRIKTEEEIRQVLPSRLCSKYPCLPAMVCKQFSNLFNAYAKSINKAYGRKGSLFQRPFKRKRVTNDGYLTTLLLYIHNNPVHHGFVSSASDWPYSSLSNYLLPPAACFSLLLAATREEVLRWFGGKAGFIAAHQHVGELKSPFP